MHAYTDVRLFKYTGKKYCRHGKEGHDAFCKLLAEGKPEEAVKLPHFQDTLHHKQYGRHGQEGHDAFCKLLAEGKPGEAAKMPYFQDTLQHKQYGRHGQEGHDAFCKLLAEGKPGEAAEMPYFQDTLQHNQYGRHGQEGHDAFVELVVANKTSLARYTPYFRDSWQYEAYGVRGYAGYKQINANVREHASHILTVAQNIYSKVQTKWMCTAKWCAAKERWYGRNDNFRKYRKQHAGGDASFVETVNRTKNGTKLGYCSLCPSAPMTVMALSDMKRHLACAGIHV